MQAKDVMTHEVVTVTPDTAVAEIARTLLEKRISAVPVIDANDRLIGIVSEGDLMRRPEAGSDAPPSWWLRLFESSEEQATRYLKTHGLRARDVMTRELVTVSEDTSLADIARTLERKRIKRVPVVRDGKLVGIVSRANLLQGLATHKTMPAAASSDRDLREAVLKSVEESGADARFLNVVVSDGVVHLWGLLDSSEEKQAVRVAAEQTPGVQSVVDETGVLPPNLRSIVWAE